jgi:copper chaperone CopZ
MARRLRSDTPESEASVQSRVPTPTARHNARAHIASHTQGRLRVRVQRAHRDPTMLHAAASQIEAQPGIHHVEVNASTGSVLVQYDHTSRTRDDVVACVEDVGILIGSVLEAGGEEVPEIGDGAEQAHSSTAASVVGTMNDLDQRLSELTGRRVDLKLLFPLALGAIGLRSAIVNGLGFAEVPAYILMWYAFDAFWKFHQRPRSAPAPSSATTEVGDAQEEGGDKPA